MTSVKNEDIKVICGVDEVGRGPLAGPVVASAVMLGSAQVSGLADSKKLSAARRKELDLIIREECIAFTVAEASVEEIEKLNILGATMLAMQRAVSQIVIVPDEVLVDGNRAPDLPYPTRAVVSGDDLIPEIQAASILAKVARDKIMDELHEFFPDYGFDQHKGYPTERHLDALRRLGPTEHHRRQFAPVMEAIAKRT